MDIQQTPLKEFKEQAVQTEETRAEGLPSDNIDSDIVKPEDFLKLNEEGHHQIAFDYIESLEAKYSEEDLKKAFKKVRQLGKYFLALVYEQDFSMDLEERARASLEKIYAEMANDDKDGFILLTHLEICYKRYSLFQGEVDANTLFQELLLLASRVMNDPKLLKKLYNFNSKN